MCGLKKVNTKNGLSFLDVGGRGVFFYQHIPCDVLVVQVPLASGCIKTLVEKQVLERGDREKNKGLSGFF